MKAYVTLETRNGTIIVPIPPLEGVVTALGEHDFYDVDVEPGIGNVKITATSKGATVTVSASTLHEACEKIVEEIL